MTKIIASVYRENHMVEYDRTREYSTYLNREFYMSPRLFIKGVAGNEMIKNIILTEDMYTTLKENQCVTIDGQAYEFVSERREYRNGRPLIKVAVLESMMGRSMEVTQEDLDILNEKIDRVYDREREEYNGRIAHLEEKEDRVITKLRRCEYEMEEREDEFKKIHAFYGSVIIMLLIVLMVQFAL